VWPELASAGGKEVDSRKRLGEVRDKKRHEGDAEGKGEGLNPVRYVKGEASRLADGSAVGH
jgi:hypothetical protein